MRLASNRRPCSGASHLCGDSIKFHSRVPVLVLSTLARQTYHVRRERVSLPRTCGKVRYEASRAGRLAR
jgi:hypothetical protein